MFVVVDFVVVVDVVVIVVVMGQGRVSDEEFHCRRDIYR